MMEGEISNFIMVWAIVVASLCYCHTTGNYLFPKPNLPRLFAILPIVCLFFVLPLNLTSVFLGGSSSFLIAWLASFKILLFAFRLGPLVASPPLPLSTFIPLACLPIKVQDRALSDSRPKRIMRFGSEPPVTDSSSDEGSGTAKGLISKKAHKFSINHFAKLILLVILIRVYKYQEFIHFNVRLFFYSLHIYFILELSLVLVESVVRTVSGIELEPPFDEPHLATSLQDFWGRRWNLMVTNILRPTVYDPVMAVMARFVSGQWARFTGVVGAFLVSGIMHELVFYNIGRAKPSGEVLCFFLLHGVCLGLENWMKKALVGKFRLPGFVSGPLTLSFVMVTSFWLFFPPMLKNMADVKACKECLAFVETLKHTKLVSPNNITCPFL
ncbi:unnamed protein product [Cuscuta epithymum]|uniref:Wax synthase domain-containing protein n=1 Tax=Cuscuta epithymum TaxID=186058 RepID=A0AAV0D5I6_9ASTE|nr:unnamed protein product [Cuscuta epithymum]